MKSLSEIAGLADLNDHPVFSPQNFDRLTLGDAVLQRQLIESFLRQGSATRADLIGAALACDDQFDEAIHHLKSTCHFVAGERLFRILRAVEVADLLKDQSRRMQAAEAIVEGLDQLEKALRDVASERDDR